MAKLDVAGMLAQAASKKPAGKSKSKTPTVSLPDLREQIDKWCQAHMDEKDAKSRKEETADTFMESVEKKRLEECRRDGKYYSSVKVDGKITVSVANKYSPIDPSDNGQLEDAFGDDKAHLFKDVTEISLTDAALSDQAILQKLINAVGAENFQNYFEVKQFIKPTDALHEGRSTNPDVAKKANKLIDAGILRPVKASVKRA
jgi:hypothetical protein